MKKFRIILEVEIEDDEFNRQIDQGINYFESPNFLGDWFIYWPPGNAHCATVKVVHEERVS